MTVPTAATDAAAASLEAKKKLSHIELAEASAIRSIPVVLPEKEVSLAACLCCAAHHFFRTCRIQLDLGTEIF